MPHYLLDHVRNVVQKYMMLLSLVTNAKTEIKYVF
jgi:hypothetical protein